MRIITGSARGKKLMTLQGMDTRPTTELVKEAVFSTIQFEIEGARVLDLFAGSGQMGLEAVSRGARSCLFADSARDACGIIGKNIAAVGFAGKCKALRADVITFLESAVKGSERYDIAFLDPPYRQGLLDKALPLVASVMSEGGVIICEAAKGESLPENAGGFVKYRDYRYGTTVIAQYRALQ